MKFRILGSLEVEADGRDVTPSGAKARALLALLILHANEPVGIDRLADEVWRDDTPVNVPKTVQIHVSRLRKALGEDRVRTVGSAYALRVDAGELDAQQAESLVDAGRTLLDEGDAGQAAASFDRALSLFRGPPLADFAYEDFAQRDIARLCELRLEATEGRIAAGLARNETGLIPQLESVVAEHPLREPFLEQLMLALYRAGRQADALAVYREACRRFRDDLGLEPGASLRALERRILNQDASLDARPAAPRMQQGHRRGSSRALAVAVVLALAAVVAGLAGWGREQSRATLPPRSLARLDPDTLEPVSVVRLDGVPSDVAAGRRSMFVALPGRRNVLSVDPETLSLSALGTPIRPSRLSSGRHGLWLLDSDARQVALLGSTRVHDVAVAPRRGPGAPLAAIVEGRGGVWLAERNAELVFRLDVATGRSRIVDNRGRDSFFEGDGPRAAAAAADSLWVSNPVTVYPASEHFGRVSRIDLASGRVLARIRLPAPPIAIAARDDAVWVALERGEQLWRLDPRDDVAAAAVRVEGGVIDLAVAEDAVWALGPDGAVTRIDPRTNTAEARVQLERGDAIAAGHGAVWLVAR